MENRSVEGLENEALGDHDSFKFQRRIRLRG